MTIAFKDLVKPELISQPVYQPGKPIEEVARELDLDPASIIKLASNENPLGASPKAIEAGKRAMNDVALYPDGGCYELKRAIARSLSIDSEQIIVGNGSNEILELLGHAFVGVGDEVVMGKGAFIVYKLVTLLFGGKAIEVPMRHFKHDLDAMAEAMTDRTKLVFLPSPDNPSGSANSPEEIESFIDKLPENVLFVLDEAYAEYLDNRPDLRDRIAAGDAIFCTRTFSKIYGLAGLRVGYGYGNAELVSLLNRVREPFNVNAVAQATAIEALQDQSFAQQSKQANAEGREQLENGFVSLGCEYIKSYANFVTVKVGNGEACFQSMQRQGVIVRPLAPYGMPEWVRVTVGLPDQNQRAIECLNSYLSSRG